MTNLILTIIGIVLAAVTALIAFDYGGDYFLVGYQRAQATTVANAGDNVAAAYSVFTVQNRRAPADLSELTSSSQGRSLLKAIPEVNGLGTIRHSWVGMNKPSSINGNPDEVLPAFVVEGVSPELCRAINQRVNGFEEDSPIPVTANFQKGCINYDASRVYVYYSYLGKPPTGPLTPYVPSVAPWPVSEGGGNSGGGTGGGNDGGGIGSPIGTVDGNGWTLCALEGGRCEFSGEATVRYGFGGGFSYKVASDGSDCNDATFGGDPAGGVGKACWYKAGRQTEIYGAAVNAIRGAGTQSTAAASRYWGANNRPAASFQELIPTYLAAIPTVSPEFATFENWSFYSEGQSLAVVQMSVKSPEVCAAINTSVGNGFAGQMIPNGQERSVAEGCYLNGGLGPIYLKFYQRGEAPPPEPTPTPTPTPVPPVSPGCASGGAVNGGNTSANGFAARYVPSRLCVGDYLDSPDGRFRFEIANSALKLTYRVDNRVIWSAGSDAIRLDTQENGNVQLFNSNENDVWQSRTWDNPGARMVLRDDGALAIYSQDGSRLLWQSRTEICLARSVTAGQAEGSYGRVGNKVPDRLCNNEYVTSPDGRFRLTMQPDGSLTLAMGQAFQNVIWQSGASNAYALFTNGDGNVQSINREGNDVWQTRTWDNPGARMMVQSDGNLVIRSADNQRELWQTRSDRCLPKELDGGTYPGDYGVNGRAFGARLCNNEYVTSPNGRFRLTMQSDGNLAVSMGTNFQTVIWQTGETSAYAFFQDGSGDFRALDRAGGVTWQTRTWDNPGARMMIQNDGNLVVRSGNGANLLWQSGSVYCLPEEKRVGTGVSNYGVIGAKVSERLCQQEYVTSPNGRFRLVMGQDGALTLRTGPGYEQVIWRSNDGSGAYALFQHGSGDYRALDRAGNVVWQTRTWDNPGAFMMVQDDGNLTIHSSDGSRLLWQTRSERCSPAEKADGTAQDLFGTSGARVPTRLCNGEYVTSPNGRFRLSLSGDGNLAIGTGDGYSETTWQTGALGAYLLYSDPNGNIRMLNRNGDDVWYTRTWDNPGARMILLNDGNLVVQSSDGSRLLWESRSDRCLPASISAGVENSPQGYPATRSPVKMCQNEYIDSPNGRFRFTLRADGRLALYDGIDHDKLIWQSDYEASPDIYRMMVRGNGEVQTIRRNGDVAWTSRTWDNYGARLLVQDDGNVAIYNGGTLLWQTNTGNRTGPVPGSDGYKAQVLRQAGALAYTRVGQIRFIPSALADVGMDTFDFENSGTFYGFYHADERMMFEVKVGNEGTCAIIAQQTGGTLDDRSRQTTTPEGCARFGSDFYYWKRVDDAQAGTQANFVRQFGQSVYAGAGSVSRRPSSLGDVGMDAAERYNLLVSPGFEEVAESRRFYIRINSATACRAIDASLNGTRTIDADNGYYLDAPEGCGGTGGSYYYWKVVDTAYNPGFATQVSAGAQAAIEAAAANGGPGTDAGRDAAAAALSTAANGRAFVIAHGIYQVGDERFAMQRVESIGLCRTLDRAAGNGDRGANLSYDPSSLAEGCGVYGGSEYWHWKSLKMVGHRYWRIMAYRSNDNDLVSASEIELRGSLGGADLTDGANGQVISSGPLNGDYPIEKAFDNNISNGLYASKTGPRQNIGHWIGYDFGAGKAVDVKEIMWQARNDSYFFQAIGSGAVQWSDDGSSWTTSFAFTMPPTTTQAQKLVASAVTNTAPDAHRYWRVRSYQDSDGYSRAMEIEMRETAGGRNYARFGLPGASSYYNDGYHPVVAFDGRTTGSSWATSGGTGWISIDLLVPRRINVLKLTSAGSEAPRDFALEWSDDNANWTEAWRTTTGPWSSNETRTFTRPNWTPPPAASIMATSIRFTAGVVDSCIQIAEVEAYSGTTNVALASNGGVATATPPYSGEAGAFRANDGVRPAGYPQVYHSQCYGGDWLRIDLAQATPIERLVLYGRQDYPGRDVYRYQVLNGEQVVSEGVMDARSGPAEAFFE